MSAPVRIVLVDDHPIVRKGLREVVEETPGMAVVGEAGDGEAALRLIEAERPDVVVLDVEMPRAVGSDGAAPAAGGRVAFVPLRCRASGRG